MESKFERVRRLLNPKSIAFVGASPRSHTIRGMLYRLKQDGFEGSIWMINPNYQEVNGFPCVPSLDKLPEPVDLAVVTIKASSVPDVVRAAADAGVGAVSIYSTGFADAGAAGARNVEALRNTVDSLDLTVCGPGSFGFVNVYGRASPFSSGPVGPMPNGNVAMVAQSGGFVNIVAYATVERGFGFSYLIAAGSELFLSASDYLEFVVEDERTSVIVAVLEDIRDVPGFERFMRRALELKKPVIVLPLGRSEAGQRATSAHSGALAARTEVRDAFLRRYGAIVVSNFDDLIETIVLLSVWGSRTPTFAAPAFMTISGGDCSLILDLANDIGLKVPELGSLTQARIAGLLPESTMLANPIDLGTRPKANPELVHPVYEATASDPAVNMIMTRIFGSANEVRNGAAGAASSGKPHLLFTRAALSIEPTIFAAAKEANLPILQTVDRALLAVQRATTQADFYSRWPASGALPQPAIDLKALGLTPASLSRRLSEIEALDILGRGGVAVVPYRRAKNIEEALRAADELAYPLVAKVDSPDIEHKTEAGGVRLNIADRPAVAVAVESIFVDVARYNPKAEIRGVILQPMLRPAVELIFGVIPDERYGAAVVIGLGGLLAETLGGQQIKIAPFDENEALESLQHLVAPRGRGDANLRGLDIAAAAQSLSRFSHIASALAPHVEAIDVNPIAVFTNGRGVCALDCLILPKAAVKDAIHD
jgi:acetyltransferase